MTKVSGINFWRERITSDDRNLTFSLRPCIKTIRPIWILIINLENLLIIKKVHMNVFYVPTLETVLIRYHC